MIPYACKVCGRFDEEGIIGHAKSRCKPLGMVANKVVNAVANNEATKKSVAQVAKPKARMDAPVSVRKANSRTKDRHKNKESRLEYARNLMRKRRAEAKAQA